MQLPQILSNLGALLTSQRTRMETFQKTLTAPTSAEIEHWSPCAICWAEYDDANMSDIAIKLPCGHVYGKNCLVDWAQGHSPNGQPNGCPHCHAQLLPRSRAEKFWQSEDVESLVFLYEAGGGFYFVIASIIWFVGAFALLIYFGVADAFLFNVGFIAAHLVWGVFFCYRLWIFCGVWEMVLIPLIAYLVSLFGWGLIAWISTR